MKRAIALDPTRWESHLTLALLQARNNEPHAAEANFKRVIELNPTAVQAYSLLGGFYQSRGRLNEAEQAFDKAMAVGPASPEPRAALVRLYLAEGQRGKAEDVAKQAAHDFPNDPVGYRMLGDLYFMASDLDKALSEYATLGREHPSDLHLKKDYIELLLQKGRFEEAGKLDAEILKSNPNDNDALVYRGQMQISNGHPNDALATLETVIKNDPDNSEAHYVLGVGFQKLGNVERAQSEWQTALHLRPDLLDAVRALAGVAMARGEMEVLDQQASEIIRLQPGSPEGYALRALSNVNRKRFSTAEPDIRKAIEIAPRSSFGHVQMGNLKYAENEFDAAGKAYQTALDLNLNSKDALRGLMNTYVAQKRVDQAISAANAQIAKSPGNSAFYDLLGTTLFYSKKDLAGASAAFLKAAELDKNNSDALIKLAQVQAASNSTDEAIATCRGALASHPNEHGFYILLGDLYQSRRDWRSATEAYQKALMIRPDNPLASNSLASVMLQSGGNLDVALSLAQTARRGLPHSPGVADTLGWVYYQKGAYHSAVDSLQEAIRLARESKSPDSPQLHYHLGMAYMKSGQTTLARQQLQQALSLNPNSSDAENARKQLAELKS
jgi:tetratricopeptide (TPR) repeat protein